MCYDLSKSLKMDQNSPKSMCYDLSKSLKMEQNSLKSIFHDTSIYGGNYDSNNYESAFRVYPNTQKLCENIQDFNTWNPGRLFCKTRVDKMFLPLFEQIVHHWHVEAIYMFPNTN